MTKLKLSNDLAARTLALRGDICEFCGKKAKPRPGAGRLRFFHICPHGRRCLRGDRLLGIHGNWPDCKECQKNYKAKVTAEQQRKRNS